MAAGTLKAVVCTSTLDLGIDWGDVDLVINVGAPKGASRLIQRVGRANHRLDEPSRALLVPSNRFEVLECRAAIEAAAAGDHDAVQHRTGALDVLAQHVWGTACGAPVPARRAVSRGPLRVALRRPDARAVRPHRRVRRHRRLRAQGLRALRAPETHGRRAPAPVAPAPRPAVPHERRHHRRGADDQDPPRRTRRGQAQARHGRPARRRARAGRAGGVFHQPAERRRHLRLCRRGAALRGPAGHRGVRDAHQRSRADDPLLRGRQVPALHAPRRARAAHAGRPAAVGRAARGGGRVARPCRPSARPFPTPARCWSRPSRAGAGISWSSTPSRAGSRTRRSACC